MINHAFQCTPSTNMPPKHQSPRPPTAITTATKIYQIYYLGRLHVTGLYFMSFRWIFAKFHATKFVTNYLENIVSIIIKQILQQFGLQDIKQHRFN